MQPVNSTEYQAAVEEAANAFMKVMALRGFAVRDYPQNFVAHMAQQTRLHFENSRAGAHADADALVPVRLRVADGPDAAAVFDAQLGIEITPGRVAPLTSPGQPTLVLDLP